ncbi:MAG: DUF1501 domain-containing protein [Patescibacteria group bacterium]
METLLDNGVGKTFYMQADGGYDTHSNQLAPSSNFDPNNVPKDLNYNIGNVASRLTDFFNRVKARHDVTIVVFSEFGRTVAVNGDIGTDHGEGGGMFVLSNNSNLLNALPQKTYGNLSFKNSKDNWLGVGIDYRSVYGKIYKSLYNLSDTNYFGETADLAKDVDETPPHFALMRPEYKANNDGYARVDLRFAGEGTNFDTSKSSYLQAWYGTGTDSLKQVNQWTVDNYYQKTPDKSFTFARDWNAEKSNYAFATRIFSSQYAQAAYSGTIRLPEVLATSVNAVSLTGDSVLRRYDSTSVNSRYSVPGSGILIADSGTGAGLSVTSSGGITLTTQTGATNVVALTASGTLTWNGGFVLGENVDPSRFLSDRAVTSSGSTSLRSMNVAKIVKIGADTLGVGMELDRNVVVSFSDMAPSSEFRILRSEDGINWVDQSNSTTFSNASGRLAFATDKFSYFAAVSVVPPPVPTCTVSATPASVTDGNSVTLAWTASDASSATLVPGNVSLGLSGSLSVIPSASAVTRYVVNVAGAGGSGSCSVSVTSTAASSGGGSSSGGSSGGNSSGTFSGGGGGGGSSAQLRDSCPLGDYSQSYYDGSCGTAPKTSTGTTSSTVSNPTSGKVPAVVTKPSVPTSATDSSMGAGNLSSVLKDKSLKGKNAVVTQETKSALDALAESVASDIIVKASSNPRKMARLFDPVKKYLEARAKKAPEAGQKKAIGYLKAKIESILRQKASGG